jgi:glyoxylase I family protein
LSDESSEKTREFYEEVIGLPLVATWSESDELFGKVRTYCHCFFGLADGGALAFFQFADKDDEKTFSPPIAETPFHHIALKVHRMTQKEVEERIKAAGYTEPDSFVLEHGYCRSKDRKADAHATLKRWLGGDHTSNNMYR